MKSRPGRALWALTCVLFFFLALVAGYLALSKAYEHLAGEDVAVGGVQWAVGSGQWAVGGSDKGKDVRAFAHYPLSTAHFLATGDGGPAQLLARLIPPLIRANLGTQTGGNCRLAGV